MTAQGPIDKNSPLWLAWEAYRGSEGFKNAKKWAQHVRIELDEHGGISASHDHIDGSLWAVFIAGYEAGRTDAELAELEAGDG